MSGFKDITNELFVNVTFALVDDEVEVGKKTRLS